MRLLQPRFSRVGQSVGMYAATFDTWLARVMESMAVSTVAACVLSLPDTPSPAKVSVPVVEIFV